MKISDEAGNAEISGELKFNVRGHTVEPSDTLIARNFLFLRAEDDRRGNDASGLSSRRYSWARFDITGYKYGDENLFSVEYGLAVLRANGDKLFEQPNGRR